MNIDHYKLNSDDDCATVEFPYSEYVQRLFSVTAKLDVIRAALDDSGYTELAKKLCSSCSEINNIAELIFDTFEEE